MSDYELKPGQGTIFKVVEKKSDKAPDYKGLMRDPNGKEWEVSLWIREGKKGKFFSVGIKEPWVKDAKKTEITTKEIDDDLPF